MENILSKIRSAKDYADLAKMYVESVSAELKIEPDFIEGYQDFEAKKKAEEAISLAEKLEETLKELSTLCNK